MSSAAGSPSSSHKSKSSSSATSTGTSASAPSRSKFTTSMQDRQARGKDPRTGRASSESESDSEMPSKKPSRVSSADDSYESKEKRRWATSVLDTPELLEMHALGMGDSVPGARQFFTRVLCGYEEKNDIKDQQKGEKSERRRRKGGN